MTDKQISRKEKQLGLTGFIFKPMYITMKQFIKAVVNRPQTILYPWEKMATPDAFRGRPGLIFDKCIGCGICMRICPTRCIDLVEVDDLKKAEGEEPKKVKRPRVNLGRCLMCGYCAEYCPTDAMIVTPDYELATFSREEAIYDPYMLQHDWKPGYEVHIKEVLPSEVNKVFEPRLRIEHKDIPVLDDEKCISCTRCAKDCPVDAVTMVEVGVNERGRPIRKPVFDAEKCISCDTCVEVCPKDALTMKEAL
ncbi:MAG: 4Fe-4S binding protein [Euryarchaeota archaeon]|nr:4Fe-4S binding protein [Euryarchaeota archaeon]